MLPHVNNIKNLILATIIVIKNMCCILIFVNFLVCKKIHNKENEKPLKKKTCQVFGQINAAFVSMTFFFTKPKLWNIVFWIVYFHPKSLFLCRRTACPARETSVWPWHSSSYTTLETLRSSHPHTTQNSASPHQPPSCAAATCPTQALLPSATRQPLASHPPRTTPTTCRTPASGGHRASRPTWVYAQGHGQTGSKLRGLKNTVERICRCSRYEVELIIYIFGSSCLKCQKKYFIVFFFFFIGYSPVNPVSYNTKQSQPEGFFLYL